MQKDLKQKFKYWQFVLYMPVYLVFFFLVERVTKDVTLINIPTLHLMAIQEAAVMPSGLPSSKPKKMPSPTLPVTGSMALNTLK